MENNNSPRVVIEYLAVSKIFRQRPWSRGGVVALKNIHWKVLAGERWLVIGPNRAGKSTLLRLLVSLLKPTAGEVYRLGQPARRTDTLASFGYLHENAPLPGYWRVGALINRVALLHGLHPRRCGQYVNRILDAFDLQDYRDHKVSQLSRGIRQKVGIACALVHEPAVVVLDDPCNSLDDNGVHQVLRLLRAFEPPRTCIVAMTNISLFRDWATHLLELHSGLVRYCGPIADYVPDSRAPDRVPREMAHALT